jgi:hypothetical protein
MPVQLIRKVRDRQPDRHVGIDLNNPLTSNLVCAYTPSLDGIVGKNSVGKSYDTGQVVHSKIGKAKKYQASSSQYTSFKINAPVISNGFTIVMVAKKAASSGANRRGVSMSSSTHLRANLQINAAGTSLEVAGCLGEEGNNSYLLYTLPTLSDDYHVYVGYQYYTGSAAYGGLYVDGKFGVDAWIGNSSSFYGSSSQFDIGRLMNNSTVYYGDWDGIAFAAIFNRRLTAGEIVSISANPWQIFEPETIPLFKPTGTGPVTHPTTGDVVGNTATVTGSALREAGAQTHPSTGDVVGNTATVSGTALRYRAHATTGVVAGLTSNVTGTALRYRLHETTGAVTGLTSTVTGSATIQPAPGIHVTSGDVVAGTGSVSGTATHIGVHTTTGVLSGFSAEVVGAAQRSGAVIVHSTSGVLAGYDSVVTGAATNQGSMTLTPADIQAIVAAIKAEIMPVNIVRVNNIDVDGTGADSDPWGPV